MSAAFDPWLSSNSSPPFHSSLLTHLGRIRNAPESLERVVQLLLGDTLAQAADEEVGADVNLLLVVRGLVGADGLAEQLDLVQDLARIVGVVFGQELAEPEPLVCHAHAVLREKHIR